MGPEPARASLEAIDPENDVAMASRDSEPETSLSRAQVTQRVYQVARERAAGDPEVVSMLDAYHAEVSERRAVMAWTGMTLPEVVNARRRLGHSWPRHRRHTGREPGIAC